MATYPGNQIPIFDINVVGMQIHNLQQQLTEYGRIVSQQQQAITQLLQKQQTDSSVQWPSYQGNRTFPRLMNGNTRNSSSIPPPQVQRKPKSNPRRRTPKDVTLGDFMPNR